MNKFSDYSANNNQNKTWTTVTEKMNSVNQ